MSDTANELNKLDKSTGSAGDNIKDAVKKDEETVINAIATAEALENSDNPGEDMESGVTSKFIDNKMN